MDLSTPNSSTRTTAALTLLVGLSTLGACGGDEAPAAPAANEQPASQQPTPAPATGAARLEGHWVMDANALVATLPPDQQTPMWTMLLALRKADPTDADFAAHQLDAAAQQNVRFMRSAIANPDMEFPPEAHVDMAEVRRRIDTARQALGAFNLKMQVADGHMTVIAPDGPHPSTYTVESTEGDVLHIKSREEGSTTEDDVTATFEGNDKVTIEGPGAPPMVFYREGTPAAEAAALRLE